MATINVSPGLNTIQAGINAANNVSGDEVVLANGTYTFNTSQAMLFDSAVTGTLFTNLTVRGESRDGVIINMTGVGFDAIYGGDASGVTIKDMTLTGTPGAGVVRDHALSLMVGFTFQNIKIDAITKPFINLPSGNIGTSITISDIVSTENFTGGRIVYILGLATDLNLRLKNIDGRLHTGMTEVVRLDDVRDVRIDGIYAYAPSGHALQVLSSDVAKGVFDVDIFNVVADGNEVNTAPLIHIGHNSLLKVTKRVRVHGATIMNSGSYGIEFEGGVEDSEILNCRVINSEDNAIPIPDSTRNILVADNFIKGVRGSLNAGIALVYGRRHRVLRNDISGCYRAIRHDETGDIALDNERNIIRDNVIHDCSFAYRVTAAAMPAGVLSNRFGPNTVYAPSVAYADTGTGNMTQAQFEAAFPGSIEESDLVGVGFRIGTEPTNQKWKTFKLYPGVTTRAYMVP